MKAGEVYALMRADNQVRRNNLATTANILSRLWNGYAYTSHGNVVTSTELAELAERIYEGR